MSTRNDRARPRLTRREAIRWLGAGLVAVRGQSAAAPFPKGAIIRTVLEDVPPDRLTGTTLFHEHLSMARADGQPIFYDDVALIADEVRACAADGVGCIVDAGVAGLGRKIAALRTIARRSGMFIVAGGGLHAKSDYPQDVFRKTAD